MPMKILSDDPDSETIHPPSSPPAPASVWRNRVADKILRAYLVLWAFFFLLGVAWEQLFFSMAGDLVPIRLARCALNDAFITTAVSLVLAVRLRGGTYVLLANMGIGRFKMVLTFAAVTYALAAATWGLRIGMPGL